MKQFALVAVLMLIAVCSVNADEPIHEIWEIYCNVDWAYEGDEPLTMFNLPDGTGSPFSAAHLPDGTVVDATLRVQILDGMNNPIANFPSEDMWLYSADDGMIPCIGGTSADMNTDENGWTVWAAPLNATASSNALCLLFVSGMVPVNWPGMELHFNSADMNGDGMVNLADIGLFSNSFFTVYSFEADFYYDGFLNLADVALLATGVGHGCP